VLKEEAVGKEVDMRIAALALLIMLPFITRAAQPDCVSLELTEQANTASGQSGEIEISIATGGGPFRPAKDTFRVGERVPVVITMTNTGSEPVHVCQSGTLYQDRPQLLKDGKPVDYMSFTKSEMQAALSDKTCENANVPQKILLRPNEPTVVDWFIVTVGATSPDDDAWYEPLQPGKYTLSNRRRLNCCEGPLIETNTINFMVIP
jgi:hypothetical protein